MVRRLVNELGLSLQDELRLAFEFGRRQRVSLGTRLSMCLAFLGSQLSG